MKSQTLLKTMMAATLLTAAGTICTAQDFDPEKTKALFAGTEWVSRFDIWYSEVTFSEDRSLIVKAGGYGDKDRVDTWTPTGPRSVKGDKREWVISPDGKELYATGPSLERTFCAFYRGKKFPTELPHLRQTLAKPGIVWVKQGTETRDVLAFNGGVDAVWSENGVEKKSENGIWIFGGGHFSFGKVCYLVQDEKGEWVLRTADNLLYRPEPAQPGDLLPPQMISRARSPFNGTSWCRVDGKGKVFVLTFLANGTVSDSAFPNEKPEWVPYDNGSVRYKVKDGTRMLTLGADKKFLVREDKKAREIWYSGRQPPRVGMLETKQLKETLADPSKAWVSWDESKKTVYTFDDKTANVSITVDDAKPKVVRWEALAAGCIRIGDEAFMVWGDTLERVEPRLTLKQASKDSLR